MMNRLVPVVLLLAAFGLFFGYIHPTYTDTIASARAEIRSYESALAAAEAFSRKESELLAERNAIPGDGLARIEAFLPDGVDNVQLIVDLNALADRSGVRLSDFDVAAPEEGGDDSFGTPASPVDSLLLSVSAAGTYDAFRTFIEAAERSLRLLDVVELSVDDAPTGVYTYVLTFRMYWLR